MGGLSVPDWRSVCQQWDFLSDCLLLYSYRLMSPPPSPPDSHERRTKVQRRRFPMMLWKRLWSRECSFTLSCVLNDYLWNIFECVCSWRLNSLHTQNISTCKIHPKSSKTLWENINLDQLVFYWAVKISLECVCSPSCVICVTLYISLSST